MNIKKCRNFFLSHKFQNFTHLEKELKFIEDKKIKGDLFEFFNYAYFHIFKERYNIEEIWDINSCPYSIKDKFQLIPNQGSEQGTDGIIYTKDGKYYSYQTKFNSSRNLSSNSLHTAAMEGQRLDGWYIFTNCYSTPSTFKRKFQNPPLEILFNTLDSLDNAFFLDLIEFCKEKDTKKIKVEKRSYQTKAISEIVNKLKSTDKGKYISACGTGKTITSLLIKEELKSNKTLFVVPSIYLVKQTLESWIKFRSSTFRFLCIVSEFNPDLSGDSDDLYDINPSELGVQSTTDPEIIKKFLDEDKNSDLVIFSTYQSLDKVFANNLIPNDYFDLAFFDEAHRTAGAGDGKFQFCFNKEKINSKKTIFMTATPRVLKPIAKKQAEDNNFDFFSMDDVEKYGEVLHQFSFRDAINNNVICDYEIYFELYEEELASLNINYRSEVNDEVFDNKDLVIGLGIEKLFNDKGINKIINFSNSISSAEKKSKSIRYVLNQYKDIYIDAISSKDSSSTRNKKMSEFKKSKRAILSNARCLTEGVDVPDVDCIVFSEKRKSVVDIVQAVGRCLRKSKENPEKIARIFIPVIVDRNQNSIDKKKFSYLFEIIEAIKAHDEGLKDEIDKLNLGESGISSSGTKKINLVSHTKNIDLETISKSLRLEIARLNSGSLSKFKNTYKNVRLVSPKTPFKINKVTFKDWKKNIDIAKTIFYEKRPLQKDEIRALFLDQGFKSGKFNNFLPLCLRIGFVKELEPKSKIYDLTKDGLRYLRQSNDHGFSMLAKNLLEKDNITWYPYIFSKKIIDAMETMHRWEFFWGPSICVDTSEPELLKCLKRIKFMRTENYDYALLKSNLESTRKAINVFNEEFKEQFETLSTFEFPEAIIVGVGGQNWGYFAKHMEYLFEDVTFEEKSMLLRRR